jgi:serine protease Do
MQERLVTRTAFGGGLPGPGLAALLLTATTLLMTVARAEPPKGPDSRALRRTPVVQVFEDSKDSVVYVTGPILSDGQSPLQEFFRLPGKPLEHISIGSGFVIHPAGYVLTNAHATEKVIAHLVSLSDGKTYPADLVATIHDQDVALLKIDAGRPLKAVRLAQAGDVMVGETVVVIANPHGLLHTCTAGVVSAVGRTTNVTDVQLLLKDLIQTDAGVNPGSSGGPWFNIAGEVMGMTTTKKRDADNIGFAIPAATLRKLLPGMLDVEDRYDLTTGLIVEPEGPCRVKSVEANSAAARCGIRPGDVIGKLGDWPVLSAAEFHLALVGRKPDEPLPIELLRDGKPLALKCTPGRRPKPDVADLLRKKLGLTAAPLDRKTAQSMILQVERGVIVTAVEPWFYAKVQHKPAPGDVLARIAAIRPRNLEQLALILEKMRPGQSVPLVLLRYHDSVASRIDINLTLP